MTQTKNPPVRLGVIARWRRRIKPVRLQGGYPPYVTQPSACGGSRQFDLNDPECEYEVVR